MPKTLRQSFALFFILLGLTAYSWAIPTSQTNPDIIEDNNPGTIAQKPLNKKEYAVKLLLESFNGNTDVDELYSALGSTHTANVNEEKPSKNNVAINSTNLLDQTAIENQIIMQNLAVDLSKK